MDLALRQILRKVAFPVTVVGTSASDGKILRAATISSWSTVCLQPDPIVSISIRLPSRLDSIIHKDLRFSINVLNRKQTDIAETFSRGVSSPLEDDERFKDRWDYFVHPQTKLPVFLKVISTIHCQTILENGNPHRLIVGDHAVWFAKVLLIDEGLGYNGDDCLLYWKSQYAYPYSQACSSVEKPASETLSSREKTRLLVELNYIYECLWRNRDKLVTKYDIEGFVRESLMSKKPTENSMKQLYAYNDHLFGLIPMGKLGDEAAQCLFWANYFMQKIHEKKHATLSQYLQREESFETLIKVNHKNYRQKVVQASKDSNSQFLPPDLPQEK